MNFWGAPLVRETCALRRALQSSTRTSAVHEERIHMVSRGLDEPHESLISDGAASGRCGSCAIEPRSESLPVILLFLELTFDVVVDAEPLTLLIGVPDQKTD